MNKKSLIQTNKFLKVASTRNSLIHSHAESTSRIEGITVKPQIIIGRGSTKRKSQLSRNFHISLKKV